MYRNDVQVLIRCSTDTLLRQTLAAGTETWMCNVTADHCCQSKQQTDADSLFKEQDLHLNGCGIAPRHNQVHIIQAHSKARTKSM